MGIKKFVKGLEETRKYRKKKRKELAKAYDAAYYKAKKTAIEAEARKAAKRAARPLGEKLAGVGKALGEGFAPIPQGTRQTKQALPLVNPDFFAMPPATKSKKKKQTLYGF